MSKSNLYRCIREFQFTQPKRAATGFKFCPYTDKTVSIHAAQAGCDGVSFEVRLHPLRFNSRSPSGLRPISFRLLKISVRFNSRSPSGLRQARVDCIAELYQFQFTQPKRAATRANVSRQVPHRCFNSRSPSGLRPNHSHTTAESFLFQFTQPKRAATWTSATPQSGRAFQFTQPKRAATFAILSGRHWSRCFNSRSPSGLRRQSATACKPR